MKTIFLFNHAKIRFEEWKPLIIDTEFTSSNQYQLNDSIQSKVRVIQKRYSLKPGFYDGLIPALVSFNNNKIVLGSMRYSLYQAAQESIFENKNLSVLTRAVNIVCLVQTSDHFLVFGFRKSAQLGNQYLPPAGFTSFSGLSSSLQFASDFFQNAIHRRVYQDVGVIPNEVFYLGFGSATDSSCLSLIFLCQVSEEKETIINRYNHEVFHHVIFVPPSILPHFLLGKTNLIQNGAVSLKSPNDYSIVGNGITAGLAYLAAFSKNDFLETSKKIGVISGDPWQYCL